MDPVYIPNINENSTVKVNLLLLSQVLNEFQTLQSNCVLTCTCRRELYLTETQSICLKSQFAP